MLNFPVLSQTLWASRSLTMSREQEVTKRSLSMVLCVFLVCVDLGFFKWSLSYVAVLIIGGLFSLWRDDFSHLVWWGLCKHAAEQSWIPLRWCFLSPPLNREVSKTAEPCSETSTTNPKHHSVWWHNRFSSVDDTKNAQSKMRLCVRVHAPIP